MHKLADLDPVELELFTAMWWQQNHVSYLLRTHVHT